MKSWIQKKMMVIAIMVLLGFAFAGVTSVAYTDTYADVSANTSPKAKSAQERVTKSDKKADTSEKEVVVSSELTEDEEEGGLLNYRNADGKDSLLCIMICSCAGLGILTVVLMGLESKKKAAAKQQMLPEEYDQLYDKYRKYYAYSAEQILRAERYDRPAQRQKVENMKETVLDIYDKMEDEKQLFDGIRVTQSSSAAKCREELYNKGRHNVAKLEHCLVVLKDVNKTCVL